MTIKFVNKLINMAKIFLNGKEVCQSDCVVINGNIIGGDDNSITINGVKYKSNSKNIEIKVEGNVNTLDVNQGNVTVNGNTKLVSVDQGNATITGDVLEDVEVDMGNVTCKTVKGNVTVDMGNVNCDKVEGGIKS